MKVATIIDGNITIQNIYEMYPYVSFPDTGVPDSFLQENNLYKVVEFMSHNEETENYNLLPTPIVQDNIVYTVMVIPKTDEEIRQYKLMKIRDVRNRLLTASDIDVTIDKWESYSQEKKDALKTYRQNLRDFPQLVQDLDNPNWPTNPSVINNR
jgi:hypothetical protein